jgi:hypothetical protein
MSTECNLSSDIQIKDSKRLYTMNQGQAIQQQRDVSSNKIIYYESKCRI